MSDQRKFEHDCEKCRFIGHFVDRDVYICPQHGEPTMVARFGNDGPGYFSKPLYLWNMNLCDPEPKVLLIGSRDHRVPYPEYVFSGDLGKSEQAMMLAMAVDYARREGCSE